MCELFAVSSKQPSTVSFSLDEFASHGGIKGIHVDGWGIVFYQDYDVQLIRETSPASNSEWLRFVRDHQIESKLILSHIRKASRGSVSLKNTQPFVREISRRKHAFAHNGFLNEVDDLNLSGAYLPIGETDSEVAFCYLLDCLEEVWKEKVPTLNTRANITGSVFEQLAETGPANFLYCDGEYLFAYGNKRTKPNGIIEPPGLYYSEMQCCLSNLSTSGFNLKDCAPDLHQNIVMFASVPLTADEWIPLGCSELIVAENGKIVHRERLSTWGSTCRPIEP